MYSKKPHHLETYSEAELGVGRGGGKYVPGRRGGRGAKIGFKAGKNMQKRSVGVEGI